MERGMNSSAGAPVFHEVRCPDCRRRAPFDVSGLLLDSTVQYRCRRCNRLIHVVQGQRIMVVKEETYHLP
jgi:phage FluMu protein Com